MISGYKSASPYKSTSTPYFSGSRYSEFWKSLPSGTTRNVAEVKAMVSGKDATLTTKIIHVPYTLSKGMLDWNLQKVNLNGMWLGLLAALGFKEQLKDFRKAGVRHLWESGYKNTGEPQEFPQKVKQLFDKF